MEDSRYSYKTRHEAFVSGSQGTSVIEVVLLCAVCPACVFLRHSLKQRPQVWLQFLQDYFFIVLPLLLSCTLLSSHVLIMLITIVSVGSLIQKRLLEDLLQILLKHGFRGLLTMIGNLLKQYDAQITHYVITEFRALTLTGTAIGILAVDFVVFPRRFCKTETFGTGLMDIGVGAFMFVNGLVSAEARGKFAQARYSNSKYILNSLKQTIPLLILGLLRVLAVKSTDYHEHVSEYGVHWNFFITLAVVKILSTLLFCIVPIRHSWFLSIIIMFSYQYLLQTTSLPNFILHGPDGSDDRGSFLNANREGIFSSFGYLALYLFSVSLGYVLVRPGVGIPLNVKFVLLMVFDVVLWLMLFSVTPNFIPVSRRLANLSYVIWMLAISVLGLCSSFSTSVLYILFHKDGVPQQNGLLGSVSKNGLLYFLLANMFTGVINMSMDTVSATPPVAYFTLISYTFVLSVVAMCLHVYNVQLKFW